MNHSNLRASLRSSLKRASRTLSRADKGIQAPTCPVQVVSSQIAFEQALSEGGGRETLCLLLACEVYEWLKALEKDPDLCMSADDQEDLFERLRFSEIELKQSNTSFHQNPQQGLAQIKKSIDLKLAG